jgi:hypothetical protein
MDMRDEIDEEVKKLLEDMERKCDAICQPCSTVRKTLSLRHCAMSANYMKGRVKEFAKPFAH